MDLSQVENETPVASEQEATHAAHDAAPPTATPQDGASPPAEADASADQQATEEQPKPRPIQKRISELVREREAARREAEYWRQQAQIAQPAPQQNAPAPVEIKPENFPTYEDYLVAKAETKASERIQTELAARAQEAQRMAEERAKAAAVSEFQARADEARNRYEDFDLVVSDPTTPITPVMADAIVQSAAGHEVAYYLGRNKQEAARIARLPPLGQAMEIARLESRLAASPRRATSAPPPPQTLSGSGVPTRSPATASTYEEYKALRMAQMRR